MPGKHAPESPASFYLSVARAVGGALVVLGVVAVIAIAATGGGGKKPAAQGTTPPPTVSTHPTVSSTPSTTLSPTATASNLARITVDVLNGTQRAGLATALAKTLKADGYTVKKVGNQGAHQALTTIYYRVGFKAAAEAMVSSHPELKRVAPAPAAQTETLSVVIGDDYKAA